MKKSSVLLRFDLQDFCSFFALFVMIGIGVGCSDPSDQLLKQRFAAETKNAERLVIDEIGEYANPAFKSVEIKGSEKIAEFLTVLDFSSKKRFFQPRVRGEYQLRLFSTNQQLLTLEFERGASLTWQSTDSSRHRGVLKAYSADALLAWLATNGCDILQKEHDAEVSRKEKRLQAERDCVASFPAEARHFFSEPGYGTEIQPWGRKRGEQLAKFIEDPVTLTVMTCNALGYFDDEQWGFSHIHESILDSAIRRVNSRDFVESVKGIQGNPRALLGAARVFCGGGYGDEGRSSQFDAQQRDFWAAEIGNVVVNDGNEENFPKLLLVLADIDGPRVNELLYKIARKQTGKTYKPRGLQWQEPTLSPAAYLCLALHNKTDIKPEIERSLATTTNIADRASLEIALAALDSTNHVRKEHFELMSRFIGETGLRVIEKFPTKDNIDALIHGGSPHPWGVIDDRAFHLLSRIARRNWAGPSRYNGDIQRWWEQHRTEFGRSSVSNSVQE